MTSVAAKPHQNMKDAVKPVVSDKSHVAGSASAEHANHIKTVFAKAGVLVKLGFEQYSKLPSNQRTAAVIAGLVLLFWPLFGVLMISPWIVFGIILAYSFLYTFPVFVQDLEEALLTETAISDKNKNHVKELSKNLQRNWVRGRHYAVEGIEIARKYGMTGYEYAMKMISEYQKKAQSSAAQPKPSVQFKDQPKKAEVKSE